MTEPKCLVNCTIPVKLRDFLKEHNINRSELFRKAALRTVEGKICPYCYNNKVDNVPKGLICRDCDKWLKFNRCPLCKAKHNLMSGVRDINGKIGCDACPEEEEKTISAVFGNEL